MTCKDCIHFEVCDSGRHIGDYIEDDGVYSDGVEKECPTFKKNGNTNSPDYNEAFRDKQILDVACGGKMFYFDKSDDRVVFMDIRQVKTNLCDGRYFEVQPDIVADFTRIPFGDSRFSMVVFDPPHLLRNTGKSKMSDMYGSLNEKARPTGYQQIKYGALYSDWKDMIAKGFKECFRVIKPGGFLIFKWNETDIKTSEVLALTDEKPIFGHKSGKASKTHWICFMKGGAEP